MMGGFRAEVHDANVRVLLEDFRSRRFRGGRRDIKTKFEIYSHTRRERDTNERIF